MTRVLRGIVVACMLAGCPGEIDGPRDAMIAPPETGCEGVAPASLDEVFQNSFAAQQLTGCTNSSCHGGGAGGLRFTNARSLYDVTVGRRALSSPTHLLVDPGNVNNSQLYLRLKASAVVRMPTGGPYLDDAALAAVAGWICANALPPSALADGGADAGAGDAGVDAGVLLVSGFAPASGLVGSLVSLGGEGFSSTAANNTVRLGSLATPVETATATSLTVRVPPGAVSAPFEVTAGGRTASSSMNFVVEQGNPVPVVSSLTPGAAVVGGPDLEVTAAGAGFIDGGVVRLDGAALTSRPIGPASLAFTVPASVLATAGIRQVTVFNPGPGGGTSPAVPFSVGNPLPVVNQAMPSALLTNGAPSTVSLTGTGFVPVSEVRLNGLVISSSFVDPTHLEALVPTVTTDGAHALTVVNPAPGGGTSAPLTLTATTVVTPTITGLAPSPAPAGQTFTLTLSGASFSCTGPGPAVLFDATTLAPAACAATQVTVSVPPTAAGTATVQLQNPDAVLSNTVSLSLVLPNPVPVVSGLTPSSLNAGGTGASVQVTGSGFITSSQVTFNGSARATTFGSTTSLSVSLSQSDLSTPGSYPIGVTNPAPGGGASGTAPLTVLAVNPLPSLSSLSPSSFVVGSGASSVSATGAGFISSSTVSVSGAPRSTTFVSSTQLNFALSSGDLSMAGSFPVAVTSPGPGGGTSNSLSLSLGSPAPVASAVTPCGVLAGTGPINLTITGSNFTSGSLVHFNGAALATSFVSATQLGATLPASAIATAPALGVAASVTVLTPAPGGGTSAALSFGIAKNNATLSANVQPIFTASCATVGCHSGVMPAEGLLLTSGQARAGLVNVTSTQCVGKTRVVACAPTRAGSVLVDKLLATATNPACAGTPMPKMQPLTATEKQAILDWIALGALP